MSVVGWLVVGLVEGFLANWLATDEEGGVWVDLILGAAGAVAGGLVFTSFRTEGFSDFDWASMAAAVVGAAVVLVVQHVVFKRGRF